MGSLTSTDKTLRYRGRRALRKGSEQRRIQILQATLRIIVREGIRGVRHRAVAKEAGVPLAATTYYFKDLDELIADAFTYFAAQVSAKNRALETRVFSSLGQVEDSRSKGKEERQALVDTLVDAAVLHVIEQVADHDDRVLEFAFMEESLRSDALREVMRRVQADHEARFRKFCQLMGTPNPSADARILHGIFLRMELLALLDPQVFDEHLIRAQIRRTLLLVLART